MTRVGLCEGDEALRSASAPEEPTDGNGSTCASTSAAHALRVGEAEHPLTPTEFRLLAALASRRGEIVRRHQLVAAARPERAIVHDNTVDAYIVGLRRKLREAASAQAIVTAPGVGHSLR